MARAKPTKTGAVERKLVSVADAVITAAELRRDPTLSIPVRSLANVSFNEKRGIIEMGKRKQARSFFNVGMANDALANKDFRYLTKTYLPRKLKEEDWLD